MQNTQRLQSWWWCLWVGYHTSNGLQTDETIQQNRESFDTRYQKHCHTFEFVIDAIHHYPFCWKRWWFGNLFQELPFTSVIVSNLHKIWKQPVPRKVNISWWTAIHQCPLCLCLGITGISPTAYLFLILVPLIIAVLFVSMLGFIWMAMAHVHPLYLLAHPMLPAPV